MKTEPAPLEIFLTKLAMIFCGKSVYKRFADCLPLKGGENVLDYGCGMGAVAFYVAKMLPQGHLTCLDISVRWLQACRKALRNYKNVDFLKSDSSELASVLANESFDLAYCHFVLHDIPEDELKEVIPALARALKNGGTLVFCEPLNDTGKISFIKRLMEQNRLSPKDVRITDIPLMGNALESIYIKQ